MKTWLMMLLVVALVAVLILGLSLLCSVIILYASRRYLQKLKKQNETWILGLLPGKNCADCGAENCQAYAREVAENDGFCRECPWLDPAVRERIEAELQRRQMLLQERLDQAKKKE